MQYGFDLHILTDNHSSIDRISETGLASRFGANRLPTGAKIGRRSGVKIKTWKLRYIIQKMVRYIKKVLKHDEGVWGYSKS